MSDESIDPDYIWPLVLLTELCASDHAKILGLVQSTLKDDFELHSADYFGASFQVDDLPREVNVRPWSPPPRLLNSIAGPGACRDSLSNIHALAVLAYRSNRPRIIVVDEATKRQLSGEYLPDVDLASPEDQGNVISVILISTRRDTISGEFSVFAKRAICSAQEWVIHLTNDDYFTDEEDFMGGDPDPQPRAFKPAHKAWGPLWAHAQGWRGLMMHDPYQEPFTSGTGDVLGREYYTRAVVTALGHHLPPELVVQTYNTHRTPIKMPVWKRRPSEDHLVIFLMYPSTAQERDETLQNLKDSPYRIFIEKECVSNRRDIPRSPEPGLYGYKAHNVTFELIPWEKHRMRTRLDLFEFWDEYRVWDAKVEWQADSMPLICLCEPMVWCHYESAFNVITFKYDYHLSPVVMRKMCFMGIWESITDSRGFNRNWVQSHHFDGIEEEFWHPERPFFYTPAPWSPMLNKDWHRTVFFLTNQLTEAAKENLERIMLRIHELNWDTWEGDYGATITERPKYSSVSWKNGDAGMVDGKLKDIWNILWDLYKHPNRTSLDPIRFVCVDKQFEVDQSVILVEAEMYEHPGHELLQHLPFPALRGFQYTRAPADVAYCANLNWINKASNYDDWMVYRRRGWPAPRLLPDYYSDADGSEQSDRDGDSPSSSAGSKNFTRYSSGENYHVRPWENDLRLLVDNSVDLLNNLN